MSVNSPNPQHLNRKKKKKKKKKKYIHPISNIPILNRSIYQSFEIGKKVNLKSLTSCTSSEKKENEKGSLGRGDHSMGERLSLTPSEISLCGISSKFQGMAQVQKASKVRSPESNRFLPPFLHSHPTLAPPITRLPPTHPTHQPLRLPIKNTQWFLSNPQLHHTTKHSLRERTS